MTLVKKIRIDAVCVPYSGHLNPLLELLDPLRLSGNYDIRIFTGVKKVESVKKAGFEVVALFPEDPERLEKIVNTFKKTNVKILYQQIQNHIELIPELIDFLTEQMEENRPDIIVADFIAAPVQAVAKQLNIPWITSIPTPFAIENQSGTPSFVGGWKPSTHVASKIRDFMGRKAIRMLKRIVNLKIHMQLQSYDLTLYDSNGQEAIYSPYAILGLGMKELEFRTDFPKHFKWAGPCCDFVEDEPVKIDYKKDQFEKTVLVTIGTHLLWGKEELLQMVEQLSSQYPTIHFLVSLGDYTQKNELPQQFSNNVTIYYYLPYSSVLNEVNYVIHHGGAGILYNCIKHNVPALIIPYDYDQFDYAARAELAQIGVRAKRHHKRQIQRQFQKMLDQKEWHQLNQLHLAFKHYKPSQVLEDTINQLLKEREQ